MNTPKFKPNLRNKRLRLPRNVLQVNYDETTGELDSWQSAINDAKDRANARIQLNFQLMESLFNNVDMPQPVSVDMEYLERLRTVNRLLEEKLTVRIFKGINGLGFRA